MTTDPAAGNFTWSVALSPGTIQRLEILFPGAGAETAKLFLVDWCAANLWPRVRFAAIKYSGRNFPRLVKAVALAMADWRDLFVGVGFAEDVEAHKHWVPRRGKDWYPNL